MAKQIKSVRFEEGLLELYTDYSNLLNEMFGYSLSFGAIVNEAFAEFLMNSSGHWCNVLENKSVVKTFPNGRVEIYEFTEEQIAKMQEIQRETTAIWGSMQQQ